MGPIKLSYQKVTIITVFLVKLEQLPAISYLPIHTELLLTKVVTVRLTARVTSRAVWLYGQQGALLNPLPQDQDG